MPSAPTICLAYDALERACVDGHNVVEWMRARRAQRALRHLIGDELATDLEPAMQDPELIRLPSGKTIELHRFRTHEH